MIKQIINIENYWKIIVYYEIAKQNVSEVMETLSRFNCSRKDMKDAYDVLYYEKDSGITYTNSIYKTTIIGISIATSGEELFNTIVHEIKHAQSHICNFFNVREDGEDAAYLCGYLARCMFWHIIKILKNYL